MLGPNGSKVEIPPGALTTNVQIAIAQSSTGSPPLPTGLTTAGSIFALTPHGTTFAVPVTVTLPFDPAAVRAGISPVMFKTNSQDQWEPVANAVFDATTVVAQITSFSFPAVLQPLERREPIRDWAIFPEGEPTQTGPQPLDFGGEIHEIRDFGRNAFITFDQDTTRTLEVFSSADGVTFWASAEDVGGGEMRQSQKFIKRAEDATLQFVITAGLLEAIDFNFGPTPAECPRGFEVRFCAPLHAFIQFTAEARTPLGELLLDRNGRPALDTGGHLKLQGRTGEWEFFVVGDYERTTAVWRAVNFAFTNDVDGDIAQFHPRAKLFAPIVLNVDLSTPGRRRRLPGENAGARLRAEPARPGICARRLRARSFQERRHCDELHRARDRRRPFAGAGCSPTCGALHQRAGSGGRRAGVQRVDL